MGELRSRKNLRLKTYDYSMSGSYFITLCTFEKQQTLSYINDDVLILTGLGQILEEQIVHIEKGFSGIRFDKYVVMPNHLHGIISVNDNGKTVGIPDVIKLLKGRTSYEVRRRNTEHSDMPIWQKSYHDRIIRDEREYREIAEYIDNNPLQWELDSLYTIRNG